MALVDYKIVQFSHEGRHVKVKVRLYRGAITTEPEGAGEDTEDVTRYRRNAVIGEKTFEYDAPRDMTKQEFLVKVRAYLNDKLIKFADRQGHTAITEQQDLKDLEAVSNEKEV